MRRLISKSDEIVDGLHSRKALKTRQLDEIRNLPACGVNPVLYSTDITYRPARFTHVGPHTLLFQFVSNRCTAKSIAAQPFRGSSYYREQDALQACHGDGSVVAVAVRADPVRDEQADLMIVTQCPGADAGAVSEFLDGPLHHLGLSRQRAGIVRPNCGSATARISEAGVATALAGDCSVAFRKADTMRAPAA